ncbi:MAG: glutathione S-transferase family protein [Oculatellaceae cyanobacterium bins.114]|nr:glutathione S-transferase family protein [Oculatellaceae cyanobacterium bins.114]
MLKLYGSARSRASIVQWYLEELAVPYEFVLLDMQSGEHHQPDFLAINPMGKVPAIVDGDLKLWESGAILIYLSDKYDAPVTLEERATIAQWVLFANATLGPGIFIEASRDKESLQLFPPLNTLFSQQTFILGDRFTAADVAVGSMLAYMPLMLKLDFSDYGAIADYLQRLAQRPGFQKTLGSR